MTPSEARTVPWERVYLFISSTFNDMHAERDFLVKKVFPQLADWCERRKLRMVDVDLRWGVTEEEATRNKNVVAVCLKKIDECRPFFLCFLGQRYGWVPKREDLSETTLGDFPGLEEAVDGRHSVTELEILHALVSPFHSEERVEEQGLHAARHAFFFLRGESYLEKLPAKPAYLQRIYTDGAEEKPETREFLLGKNRTLREETVLEAQRPVIRYEAEWSEEAGSPELALPVASPALLEENVERWRRQWREAAGLEVAGEEVGPDQAEQAEAFNEELTRGRLTGFQADGRPLERVILESLEEAIAERFPEHVEVGERTGLQRELDQQDQFLTLGREGFIERKGDFDKLDDYVKGDSNRLFVLSAPGGMGKSTLLANWVGRRQAGLDREAGETLHHRFIGQSDGSTTVDSLLRLLLEELRETTGKLAEEIPADPKELRQKLPELLEAVGTRGTTILVFDALNQLETGLSDLRWLPRELPPGIKLVVSFKRGEEEAEALHEEFLNGGEVHVAEVDPFDELEDRRELVRAYLSQYLKQLDERHLEQLIRSEGAENPLFLKVVLSELRVFGAFASLGGKIRQDFGTDPVSAFGAVLKRLERDPVYSAIPPAEAVPLLFGLLAHARHGLSVEELTDLFVQVLELEGTEEAREGATDTVYLFLRQMRPFLARRDGRYDFFFESFQLAARKRYAGELQSEAPGHRPVTEWHGLLADFFLSLPLWREPPGPTAERVGTRLPTLRKVAELPYHLTLAEDWDHLEDTLCDLEFVEAKCAAEATRELTADYTATIRAHPARTEEQVPPEDREADIDGYVQELVAYSKEWTRIRDLQSRPPDLEEPGLPEAPEAVYRWSDRKQANWSKRIRDEPTQFDRLWAFGRFVSEEFHNLERYGHRAGFCRQQAFNRVRDGPVGEAAESAVASLPHGRPFLLSRSGSRRVFVPFPGLLQVFEDETGSGFSGLALTPCGRWLATASGDGTVGVWNLAAGRLLRRLVGHTGRASSVAITPDGRVVVSGGEDWTVRVWDMNSERFRRSFEGPSATLSVTVTPDGRLVASGHEDGEVVLWDTRQEEVVEAFLSHSKPVFDVGITPDGLRVVSACLEEGIVRIWDASDGSCLNELNLDEQGVISMALNPSGEIAIGTCLKTICLCDIEGGGLGTLRPREHLDYEQQMEETGILSVVQTPDAGLTLGGGDREFHVWYGCELLNSFSGHPEGVNGLAVTADGRRAVSVSREIRLWDIEAGKDVDWYYGHRDSVIGITVTPNGRYAVTAGQDASFSCWDLKTGKRQTMVRIGQWKEMLWSSESVGLETTPDSRRVLTSQGSRELTLWELPRVPPGEAGTVERIWEVQTELGEIGRIAVAADASRAVTVGQKGLMRLWDLENGDCCAEWSAHTGPVSQLRLSPDGRTAVTGGEDDVLRVWDLENGSCLREMALSSPPRSLLLTPDGRGALVDSEGERLRLLNLHAAVQERTFEGGPQPSGPIALTPSGLRAFTANEDGSLSFWDLRLGLIQKTLPASGSRVFSLATMPGERLLFGGADKTLRIWNPEADDCSLLTVLRGAITHLAVTDREVVVGSRTGELMIFETVQDTAPMPRVTAVRRFLHSEKEWELFPTARCAYCGHQSVLPTDICASLQKCSGGAKISAASIEIADLPVEALEEPSLRMRCGSCDAAFQLNPFLGDTAPPIPDEVLHERPSWERSRSKATRDGASRVLCELESGITALAAARDGRIVVSGSRDRAVRVWDSSSGEVLQALDGRQGTIEAVAVTEEDERVLALVGGEEAVRILCWDLRSGKLIRHLKGAFPLEKAAVSADGSRAVIAAEGKLRIWDLEGNKIWVCPSVSRSIIDVALSAHGRWLALGSSDGDLMVQDLTGLPQITEKLQVTCSETPREVAIALDGSVVVSGGSEGTISVWDVESAEKPRFSLGVSRRFSDSYYPITALAVSPDGRRLVSSCDDENLTRWDLGTGRRLSTYLVGHVSCCAFSPDGRSILVAEWGRILILKA